MNDCAYQCYYCELVLFCYQFSSSFHVNNNDLETSIKKNLSCRYPIVVNQINLKYFSVNKVAENNVPEVRSKEYIEVHTNIEEKSSCQEQSSKGNRRAYKNNNTEEKRGSLVVRNTIEDNNRLESDRNFKKIANTIEETSNAELDSHLSSSEVATHSKFISIL